MSCGLFAPAATAPASTALAASIARRARRVSMFRPHAQRSREARGIARAAERVGALQEIEQLRGRRMGNRDQPFAVAAGKERGFPHLVGRLQAIAQGFGLRLAKRPGEMGEPHGQRAGEALRPGLYLGEGFRQKAGLAQHVEHPLRVRLGKPLGELLPDPLGDQRVGFSRIDHAAHEVQGLGVHLEAESRREPRHAQDAHRVLGERRADVAQEAPLEVLPAAEGVDQRAVLVPGDRVDGEVAPAQVFLERDIRRGVHREALVAAPALSLGAGERVLLVRPGMQEDREVLADRLVAPGLHLLGRGAHDDMVPVLHREPEQLVAHRAADDVDLHSARSYCGIDSGSRSAASIHSFIAGSASIASR